MIHTALHNPVQLFFQFTLVYIMLILSHPDRLGIDLHKLAQRIKQPPANAHRSPYRHILVRKFLPRYLRSRIDRSPAFVHHKDADLPAIINPSYQLLRLPASRPIAHTDRLNFKTVGQLSKRVDTGLHLILRRMGIDCTVMKEITLRIETDNLAARTEARIQ